MKITTLIAVSVLSLTAMAANAGDGFLNAQRVQAARAAKNDASASHATVAKDQDAAREAANRHAGEAIKANRDNYRNK